ncbi:hypothetical protein BsWGS_18924 [Bradybaena similaris]
MSLSGEAVLYAASPSDKLAQESARRERRRRRVYKELFETEKTYLHHLQLVNKFFDFPLKFAYIVPEDVHCKLFSNLEQIRDVNLTLLEQMEQTTVGQAFTYLGPFLKLYSTYARNHQCALTTLQEWQNKSAEFARFVSRQEDRPEVKGLKLNALLITPIQRIPRYKMLLEELLNHTPVEHHDYHKLKEATEKIGEIASHINEHVRQNENFIKMLAIQRMFDSSAPKLLTPGRLFLKEGLLKKVSRKGGKSHDRMFFLFSDILLYGKPKFLDGGGKSYTCSCVLPLRHCKVDQVFVTAVSNSDTGGVFRLTCKEESLVLYSEDKANARHWSEEIDRAIRKICDDRQTLRKPSSNKIPLRGRSLRKHRQEQKRADVKIPEKTPLRPLSVISNNSGAANDLDNSGDVRDRLEPVRQHFKMARETGLSQSETALDSPPILRKRKQDHFTHNVDQGVSLSDSSEGHSDSDSCQDSLRSGNSQDSEDTSCRVRAGGPVRGNGRRQSLRDYSFSLRGSRCRVDENYFRKPVRRDRQPADTNIPCNSSGSPTVTRPRLKSVPENPDSSRSNTTRSLDAPSTSSSVWFPPNSIAHKYRPPRRTLNQKLRACLGRPLKRFQKSKTDGSSPCRPAGKRTHQ